MDRNKIATALAGIGLGAVGLWLLTRKAEGTPPNGGDGEAEPFSYSGLSIEQAICPGATAYTYPIYDAVISNDTSEEISHSLDLWYQSDSGDPHNLGLGNVFGAIGGHVDLTLSPGESYSFHFEGYPSEDNPSGCAVGLGLHHTYTFWLEDELGNQSPGVNIARP